MTITVRDKSFVPFISAQAIQARIATLGEQITQDYADKNPLCIGILNGAFVFAADLVRAVACPLEISFLKYASYEKMQSSGKVKQLLGINENLEGRHIIIIEDIVDTGATMQQVRKDLKSAGASSVKLAALLFKPKAVRSDIHIDYLGFEIENRFVVGYGLDYDGAGRNLDAIYVIA
ncbi:MAG: hypoxanthine phosphoribosyltransferase [Bernardetiaceae bacterium]|nr:hypoxanthine phosphoribosyltransferase [Bernardetiaceae bacterium]